MKNNYRKYNSLLSLLPLLIAGVPAFSSGDGSVAYPEGNGVARYRILMRLCRGQRPGLLNLQPRLELMRIASGRSTTAVGS